MTARSFVKEENLKKYQSKYVLDKYYTCFNDDLAKKYLPIIYKNECYSGEPFGVYYRIVVDPKPKIYCIQYYYYWKKQFCIFPHRHDYEPILVFLNNKDVFPYGIVNSGFSSNPTTSFHKVELRPLTGKRSKTLKKRTTTITKAPNYPFGKSGKSKTKVWFKSYPLKGSREDLTFRNNRRARFGIKNCSNVFSGAKNTLRGSLFNPPLRRLTDKVLDKWYFQHYKKQSDMPFGHDVASPFIFPFINYRDARPNLPRPKQF